MTPIYLLREASCRMCKYVGRKLSAALTAPASLYVLYQYALRGLLMSFTFRSSLIVKKDVTTNAMMHYPSN
jgi:hypothetical protein